MKFIILLLFISLPLGAKELNVESINPSGVFSHDVKKIFIKLDRDLIALGENLKDLENVVLVDEQKCQQVRIIGVRIIECTLAKSIDSGTHQIKVLKGLSTFKQETLSEDVVVELKVNSQEKMKSLLTKSRDFEERFILSNFSCYPQDVKLSDYYAYKNVGLAPHQEIRCELGRKVHFSYRGEIEDPKKITEIFVPDSEYAKQINKEILDQFKKEDQTYFSLSFTMPQKEGVYQLSFSDKFTGIKSGSKSSPAPLMGTTHFTLLVDPKAPDLTMRQGNLVYERNGEWKIPFQYVNIDKLKYKAKITGKKKSEQGTYQFEMKRNEPQNYFFDFEKQLKLEYGKSHKLELELESTKAAKDLEESFIRYNQSYWREVKNFHLKRNFVIQTTNLGVHFKLGHFNHLAFVFRLDTGEPISEAEVALITKNNKVTVSKTNREGVALIDAQPAHVVESVVVSKDDDKIEMSDIHSYESGWSNGIAPYEFLLNYDDPRTLEKRNFHVAVVPDRPLYRPGDEVRLKIFSRKWGNKFLETDKSLKEVKLQINDSRGEKIYEKKLTLNKYGTATTQVKLKVDAKTGDYKVLVATDHTSRRFDTFKVEEFRTPTIKITTKSSKEKDQLHFEAVGQYYFGGTLGQAKGEMLLAYKPLSFEPQDEELKAFYYGDYDFYNYSAPSFRLLKKQDVEFDRAGIYQTTEKLKDLDVEDYGELVFEVNTKDANGAKIAGRSSLKIGKKYYAGARTKEWGYPVNSTLNIQAVLMNDSEKLIFDQDATITLYQVQYDTVRRKGAGNYYYYDYKEKQTKVDECDFEFNKKFTTCKLKVREAGSYFYEITTDEDDIDFKPIKRYLYVWGGEGYISQKRYNHPRIDVLLDKKDYRLGETAQILIKSPFDTAKAILTIERAGIIEQKTIDLKSSLHKLEWKIDKDYYLPGFYVSVVIVKGRTSKKIEGNLDLGKPSFYMGYAQANVTSEISKLDVSINSNDKSYEPKDEISLDVSVLDYQKKGVRSELAVAVVDEAILDMVSGYLKKYQIHDQFYHLQSISIKNFNTLVNLVGRQSYGKKGGNSGGGGGLDPTSLRKNFQAVAYWNPQLETDKSGKATIKFKAPDNLTTWKAIVVAVDTDRRFGSTEKSFKVNKKLMIESALPNFITEFDWFNGKFVLHNRSTKDLEVSFSLKSDQFVINKGDKQTTVKADGSTILLIPINSQSATKPYSIIASAKADKYDDAISQKIPVVPMRANNIQVVSGTLNGKEFSQDIVIPQTAREGSQKLKVTYSHSRLTNLSSAFKYILDYPYGCWEQRLSKGVFWGLYEGLKTQINLEVSLEHDPKKIVQELIDLAPKYQGKNGGFKFYPSSYGEESPYLSVFTAEAFILYQELGFKIDESVKEKLAQYLINLLKKDSYYPSYFTPKSKTTLKSFSLYVLAKWNEGNWRAEFEAILKSHLDSADLEALSYLLKTAQFYDDALKKSSGHLQKIQSQIEKMAQINEGYTYFKDNQTGFKYLLSTPMKNQCHVFSALHSINAKDSTFFDKQINYIFSKRLNGHWSNTQENMVCFKAAYDYLKKESLKDSPVTVKLSLDKNVVDETKIKKKWNKPISKQIKEVSWGKKQVLALSPSSQRKVYYTLQLEYLDLADSDKAINKGFEVKKFIYRMNVENQKWEILEAGDELKRGDILKIGISVYTDQPRYQVGIHDPLAGAFEPINYNLDTTSLSAKLLKEPVNDKRYSPTDWEYYSDYFYGTGFHYADLRLQAVQFYAENLAANRTYYVEYAVSVIASGQFLIDATKVEEMYYPDVHGLTPVRKIKVKE